METDTQKPEQNSRGGEGAARRSVSKGGVHMHQHACTAGPAAKKIEQGSSEYKTHRESVNPFSAKDTITLYLYIADSCLLLY